MGHPSPAPPDCAQCPHAQSRTSPCHSEHSGTTHCCPSCCQCQCHHHRPLAQPLAAPATLPASPCCQRHQCRRPRRASCKHAPCPGQHSSPECADTPVPTAPQLLS